MVPCLPVLERPPPLLDVLLPGLCDVPLLEEGVEVLGRHHHKLLVEHVKVLDVATSRVLGALKIQDFKTLQSLLDAVSAVTLFFVKHS